MPTGISREQIVRAVPRRRFVPVVGAVLPNEAVRIDMHVAKILQGSNLNVDPRTIPLFAIAIAVGGNLIEPTSFDLGFGIVELEVVQRLHQLPELANFLGRAAKVESRRLDAIIVNLDRAATKVVQGNALL